MFDAITSLLGDFDLSKFIPDIETALGKFELAARICVMLGPLVLLGLGLWYLLAPPKDMDSRVGFHTFRRAQQQEIWDYTQRLAGIVWGAMGTALTLIMALICNGYRGLNALQVATSAVICIFVELVLLVASIITINVIISKMFYKKEK